MSKKHKDFHHKTLRRSHPSPWTRLTVVFETPKMLPNIRFLTCALASATVRLHNSGRHFSFPPRIFRRKCIHTSRSSPCRSPATTACTSHIPVSSVKPWFCPLSNMDIFQVWAAEFRHLSGFLARHGQQAGGKRLVPLYRQAGHVADDVFNLMQ